MCCKVNNLPRKDVARASSDRASLTIVCRLFDGAAESATTSFMLAMTSASAESGGVTALKGNISQDTRASAD